MNLPGVLLVSVVIFIYIMMRVTAQYALSIKDPSYFGSFARLPFYRGNKPPAGDDEEAQNRLTLDLISAERSLHSKDLSIPNLGRCTQSMDYLPPRMAGGDDDDFGQKRLVAGLTPAARRSTHSMLNPPHFAGDDKAQNRLILDLISAKGRCTNSMFLPPDMAGDDFGQKSLVAGLTPVHKAGIPGMSPLQIWILGEMMSKELEIQ